MLTQSWRNPVLLCSRVAKAGWGLLSPAPWLEAADCFSGRGLSLRPHPLQHWGCEVGTNALVVVETRLQAWCLTELVLHHLRGHTHSSPVKMHRGRGYESPRQGRGCSWPARVRALSRVGVGVESERSRSVSISLAPHVITESHDPGGEVPKWTLSAQWGTQSDLFADLWESFHHWREMPKDLQVQERCLLWFLKR